MGEGLELVCRSSQSPTAPAVSVPLGGLDSAALGPSIYSLHSSTVKDFDLSCPCSACPACPNLRLSVPGCALVGTWERRISGLLMRTSGPPAQQKIAVLSGETKATLRGLERTKGLWQEDVTFLSLTEDVINKLD